MKQTGNSIVEQLINYLKKNNGKALALDICSEVMGLTNCGETTALSIIHGLPADSRYKISDGFVQLRSTNKEVLIKDLEYVVIDIEATSLPAPRNRITEFAAVLLSEGELAGEYQTLVNPGMNIPSYVQKITGITNDMVDDARTFEEVAEEIVEVIGDRVIVAHNSQFDVGILNAELERCLGFTLINKSLCTVKLARKLQPGLDKYRLGDVANYFGFEIEERHRAFADAEAAAKIFLKLMEKAEEKNITKINQLEKLGATSTQKKSKKNK